MSQHDLRPLKILAFGASSRAESINKRLAGYAAGLIKNADVERIDLNDFAMPLYSADLEAEGGIPDEAHRFLQKITDSDVLVVSFAEHNGSFTAAFKNVFDWCSRIKMQIYQDKPMLMMATSVGPRGGQNVLKIASEAAPFFGGKVTSTFNFGPFAEHFDAEAESLKTPDLAAALKQAVAAFHDGLNAPNADSA